MLDACSIAPNRRRNTSRAEKHTLRHNLLPALTGRDGITDTKKKRAVHTSNQIQTPTLSQTLVFTLLVFSATGGMGGKAATVMY